MSQFTVSKHGRSRFWAVRDPAGVMVCVCVYKRGAIEVIRRLVDPAKAAHLQEAPATYHLDPWTPKTSLTD
jgi:hypothetical protein